MSDQGLSRAKEAVRGATALARMIGVSHTAVLKWRRVPAERVLQVERLTGVSRYDLRPDIYGPAPGPSSLSSASVPATC
jgi:DNA-binding transcriptional regulator YdaS (Cro superfamily)